MWKINPVTLSDGSIVYDITDGKSAIACIDLESAKELLSKMEDCTLEVIDLD